MSSEVFFLGDSQLKRYLQVYYKDRLQSLVNITQSGSSVSLGLDNFNKFLDAYTNKAYLSQCSIVILLGTNDCKHLGHSNAFDRASFKRVTLLARRFFGLVLLCKVPPIPKLESQTVIDQVNRYINSYHSVKNIVIIDLFSPFMLPSEALVNLNYFERRYANRRIDLVHVNKAGFKIFRALFTNALDSY